MLFRSPSCKYPLYGTAPEPTISQRSPLLCATIVTILLVPKSIVGTVIFMNSHTPCFPVWSFCRTAEAGKIAVLTPLYLGFCQPVSRRLFPARQAQSPIQYTIFHYKPFFSGMQVLSGVLFGANFLSMITARIAAKAKSTTTTPMVILFLFFIRQSPHFLIVLVIQQYSVLVYHFSLYRAN